MFIKRERFPAKIRPFYDADLIKVLIGVRRCGKSVLLEQIEEELREQIKSCGIGTAATRAATLEKLVKNEYLKLSPKTQVLGVAPYGYMVYEAVKQTIPSMLSLKFPNKLAEDFHLIIRKIRF